MTLKSGPTGILRPLVSPHRGFSPENSPRVSPAALMIALFVLFTAGQRLYNEFYRGPAFTVLAIDEMRMRLDEMMMNAPPGARDRALSQAVASYTGSASVLTDAISTVLPGALLLLYVLETGALLVLCSQFLGGEERDDGTSKHRSSKVLAAYVFLPIAFRKAAAGSLVWLQDPSAVWNAASLSAFRESTSVSFSLFSFVDPGSLPFFLRHLLYLYTDPFFLWMFVLLAFGFSAVFRVKTREGVIAAAAVTVALTFNETLLNMLGLAEALGHIV